MVNKIIKIITVENKKDEKILRHKTEKFDFSKFSRKEIAELIKQMADTMKLAEGVGLSANQIGLNLRVFVAQLPELPCESASSQHDSALGKFYTIFNPEITKFSKEKMIMEEGCLSVPGFSGLVERPEKITLVGQDKNARKIKIKAWGLLARIFQHEVDHLNGILFIDKAKNIQKIESQSKI